MASGGPLDALDLWITGGGTREPIDDVRYLGNRSTGRLALALTRSALDRGHRVTLILAGGVPAPADHARLSLVRFESSRDLAAALEREPGPDALLHAAAVADYAPEPVSGKVASGQDHWPLVLHRQPKLADRFHERHPGAHLTLFKLESRVEPAELARRARAAAERAGAQVVFANLLEEVGEDSHGGWLVPAAGGEAPLRLEGREAVANALLERVETEVFERRATP